MTKPKPDTTLLVAALVAEYATCGDHPERATEIEQQLASLGATIPSEEEEH